MSAPAVTIAAAGWQDLADAAAYYPDDLPDDWRLAYFANEHPAVYLPADRWQPVPVAVLRSWHDDVNAAFRFFLEWPGAAAVSSDAVAALGDRLAGWVDWRSASSGALVAPAVDQTVVFGQALRCPAELARDLRAAAGWLRERSTAAPATLVILCAPTSTQLAEWRQLQQLLGYVDIASPPA